MAASKRLARFRNCFSMAAAAFLWAASPALADSAPREYPVEGATMLSAFGERPVFSPDGRHIAFVGRSYGDAYEIEIATGKVRNLTRDLPHQGLLRVHYLPNGDYLLTGPRRYTGPNSRVDVEMWVLRKDLQGGLQPLGEKLFEGIAISRRTNFIGWTAFDPPLALKQEQFWMNALEGASMKRYTGRIVQQNGRFRIADKREIMTKLPAGCGFSEPQDFRANDSELLFYCGGKTPEGGHLTSVMGYRLGDSQYTTYRSRPDEYNETEGVAPDGSWTTVECGTPSGAGSPTLDICRVELKPHGARTRLIAATAPGSTRKVSNSVVSPDGKWVAFQMADLGVGELGEGQGIYIVRIAD